jgi:hypothetical protein
MTGSVSCVEEFLPSLELLGGRDALATVFVIILISSKLNRKLLMNSLR